MEAVKTKEWLLARFATGAIPTEEDYKDLLDSYWHKNEAGQVLPGDSCPVTGGAVSAAVSEMLEELTTRMHQEMEAALPRLLQGVLGNYVSTVALVEALSGVATRAWVEEKLTDKASSLAVVDALSEKVDAEALSAALLAKVDSTALSEALALKADSTALSEALAGKASVDDVYTKRQIDAVVAARPTQTEMAGEMSAAMDDVQNSNAIAALRDALNVVIARTNTLSHVACGSETMNACPMDLNMVQ